ncbi:hypothetical protein AURDEDRAFT_162119 [Auricularia subglabra TFB-10046 SS5]|nr:hypothetical protein AURDEDRAFT_162119 [Auricularia subglabra TFB-10046 SS5]
MFGSSALRARYRANTEALRALEDDIPSAEEQEARALAAYEEAGLRVANLRQRQTLLTADNESLAATLNTAATFPFDLLSLIFSLANTVNDQHMQYDDYENALDAHPVDEDRVALPWRLGLVCRRWREAVLATPSAWSYVGIAYKLDPAFRPCARDLYSTPFPLLKICLDKSGSVPLDVVIYNEGGNQGDRDISDEHHFFRPRFQLLHEHMHRIRCLHVTGTIRRPDPRRRSYYVTMYQGSIDLLRNPAPSLVELRIHCMHVRTSNPPAPANFWQNFPTQSFPLLLPLAPKLRELSVNCAAVVCRRPHPGLPSLRRLVYKLDNMYDVHLHDMLAIAPSLERLWLEVDTILHDPNTVPVTLDPIRPISRLELRAGQSFGLLADGARLLPSINHLVLYNLAELSVTPALSKRLRRLGIVQQEDLHDYVGILRQLGCVECVEIGDGVTMRDDLFFEPFCDPQDPMWPKLRVIVLGAVDMVSVDQHGVLRLLHARNIGGSEGARIAGPIEEVDIESGCLPEWVAVQVRARAPSEIPEVDSEQYFPHEILLTPKTDRLAFPRVFIRYLDEHDLEVVVPVVP